MKAWLQENVAPWIVLLAIAGALMLLKPVLFALVAPGMERLREWIAARS